MQAKRVIKSSNVGFKTINCLDTLGGMVVAVGAAAAVVVEHDYIVEAPDADSTAMVEAVEVEMNL